MKIDEVSKGSANQSATSERTSAPRDLHCNGDNTEAIDSQLREFADASKLSLDNNAKKFLIFQ